jgi:hypothetical protein
MLQRGAKDLALNGLIFSKLVYDSPCVPLIRGDKMGLGESERLDIRLGLYSQSLANEL